MLKRIVRRIPWNSLRFKLSLGIVAITLPFCVYLFFNSFYSTYLVRKQVALTDQRLLSMYMSGFDDRLHNVDFYLADFIMSDTDMQDFMDLPNADDRGLSRIKVYHRIANDIQEYPYVDSIFVYSESRKDFFCSFNGTIDYAEKLYMQEYITGLIDSGAAGDSLQNGFFEAKVHGQYYLLRLFQNGDMYMGSWMSVNNLKASLNLTSIGTCVFADGKDEPMDDGSFVAANNIHLNSAAKSYFITGEPTQYLQVYQKSHEGDFGLFLLVPDRKMLGSLEYLSRVAILLAFVSILLAQLYFLLMRFTILKPFKRILAGMRSVANGDIDARVDVRGSSDEFVTLSNTFNNMMTQIRKLKIDVYEKQIEKQKEELENLHLQIRPHFFINSLRTIYSLAQLQNYALIQEMSLCLSNYFRYLLKAKTHLASLDDEIGHIRNYLRIQELRFPGGFTYEIRVPEALLRVLIPPLIVQTFIENAIKYALNMENPIQIVIEAGWADDPTRIFLRIRNTGSHIDEEMLRKIRSGGRVTDTRGEHIGFFNTRRRLKLIYGESAELRVGNTEPEGVSVEIILPFCTNADQNPTAEESLCSPA